MRKMTRKRARKQHKLIITGIVIAAVILCIAVAMMLLSHFGVFAEKDGTSDNLFYDEIEMNQDHAQPLGHGLELLGVGRYAGMYLEDGSNDVVSDVMMIKIKNTSDKDLQLARLALTYSDFTAEFELTNLPAGRTVVVLEKRRLASTDQNYQSSALRDVVFFPEQMDVDGEVYQISGMKGTINLQNCSKADVSGDIYIYYKYTADDILYGGITYRAKITGGIAVGETKQVVSSHFDPAQCIILAVTGGA